MSRIFNGSTDRIDWDNIFNPVGSNQTVSAWVNLDTIPSSFRYIWVAHNAANNGVATIFYFQYVDATHLQVTLESTGSTSMVRRTANTYLLANYTGGWHHFLYTWDGSTTAANAHIYIDGAVDDTSETNGVTLTAATGKWSIGGRIYDDARNLDGKIAEIAVWNVIVDGATIADLADGADAYTCYPENLQFYADLLGANLTDPVSETTGTADGTTESADHPTINDCGVSISVSPSTSPSCLAASGWISTSGSRWSSRIHGSWRFSV